MKKILLIIMMLVNLASFGQTKRVIDTIKFHKIALFVKIDSAKYSIYQENKSKKFFILRINNKNRICKQYIKFN